MLMTMFDSLVKYIIQLKTEKDKRSAIVFNEFLKPLNENFETVHKDYMASFRAYKEAIDDKPESIRRVIRTISDDRIFNDGQRTKLIALVHDEGLNAFRTYLTCILEYFFIPTEDGTFITASGQTAQSQGVRKTLIEQLAGIANPESIAEISQRLRDESAFYGWADEYVEQRIAGEAKRTKNLPSAMIQANEVLDASVARLQRWYNKSQDELTAIKRSLLLPR